jgi:hypothetical protein
MGEIIAIAVILIAVAVIAVNIYRCATGKKGIGACSCSGNCHGCGSNKCDEQRKGAHDGPREAHVLR